MRKKRAREINISRYSPIKKTKVESNDYEQRHYKSSESKSKITLDKDLKKEKHKTRKNLFQAKSLEMNNVKIKTIEELHKKALEKYQEIKGNPNINYNDILNDVISIYDLDEEINKYFLYKLNDYYKENKNIIDNGKEGESDKI